MIDTNVLEKLERLDDATILRRLPDSERSFFEYGFQRGYNRGLKDLWHPASEVPRNDNGKVLAYSKERGYRKLYDMNDELDKTTCDTYQEMWEEEVKMYRLTDWIFIEDLIDLIKKGGENG